jgi:hypothetical protein
MEKSNMSSPPREDRQEFMLLMTISLLMAETRALVAELLARAILRRRPEMVRELAMSEITRRNQKARREMVDPVLTIAFYCAVVRAGDDEDRQRTLLQEVRNSTRSREWNECA